MNLNNVLGWFGIAILVLCLILFISPNPLYNIMVIGLSYIIYIITFIFVVLVSLILD